MRRELICWRCTCSKCGHQWTTKNHELPKTCAKCKSVKWNDDYKESAIESVPQRPLVKDFAPIPPPVEVKIAPPEDWEGWSEERETVQNGDKIIYRQHFKTGRVQEIRRESSDFGA